MARNLRFYPYFPQTFCVSSFRICYNFPGYISEIISKADVNVSNHLCVYAPTSADFSCYINITFLRSNHEFA
ncbi:hypothetical protein FC18_GL000703 [Lacticaseibacillus sharpeae JCM 1186 = DSM 20505]|uniref:Uncharacterized protein n=1 Tax=Lacticaseibacillus sharpeae JCM 1186 = DSM 20505 TaxID=1291052 RepID=A0A0R1ZVQ7_9LACO|nr:hypothetical protein FC18_GL000703 [Lacticaseibacillus sharpeae JCM 1186 = DSM 20505]